MYTIRGKASSTGRHLPQKLAWLRYLLYKLSRTTYSTYIGTLRYVCTACSPSCPKCYWRILLSTADCKSLPTREGTVENHNWFNMYIWIWSSFPPQHAYPLCSSTINQLWFSMVQLACCKILQSAVHICELQTWPLCLGTGCLCGIGYLYLSHMYTWYV